MSCPPPDSPPVPTLTSSSTSPTPSTPIKITATFNSAVSSVAVADFNSGVAFPAVSGITYSVAAGVGTQWILTVALPMQ